MAAFCRGFSHLECLKAGRSRSVDSDSKEDADATGPANKYWTLYVRVILD
jgi:hypothetical protein